MSLGQNADSATTGLTVWTSTLGHQRAEYSQPSLSACAQLHNHTARVLLLRGRVEHLALSAQPLALGD